MAGCLERSRLRARLAYSVACVLVLAFSQFSLQSRFLQIHLLPQRPPNSETSDCRLSCTLGSPEELQRSTHRALLLKLPHASELLHHQRSAAPARSVGITRQQHRCIMGQAALQLPPGREHLARVSMTEAPRAMWLPDGALLRVPLALETPLNESRGLCDRTEQAASQPFLLRVHARCSVPPGALLSLPGTDIEAHGAYSEGDALERPDSAETRDASESKRCRAAVCTHRLALAGHEPHTWNATVAAAPSMASHLFARLDERRAVLRSAAPPEDTVLSVLFPLPRRRSASAWTMKSLHSLAAQLEAIARASPIAAPRGPAVHIFHDDDARAHSMQVQLILLAQRPVCDGDASLIAFLSNQSITVLHLHVAPHNNGPARILRPLNRADTPFTGSRALAAPAPFGEGVWSAWDVLARSSIRMVADGQTTLPAGALQARLMLLWSNDACDAVFVPPGAGLGGGALAQSTAKQLRDVELSAEPLRTWHFFELAQAPSGGPPWLSPARVLGARVPRGAWPLWDSSRLPARCIPDGGPFVTPASDDVSIAEANFWLQCMGAGAVICRAAIAPSRPPLSLQASANAGIASMDVTRFITERHTEHMPEALGDSAVSELLARHQHMASQRILLVHESAAEFAAVNSVRIVQLVAELSAEGHAVTVLSTESARAGVGDIALQDAGWLAFCPSCAMRDAAFCSECGDVQSAAFVTCRQQAATRHPHRAAVVGGGEAMVREWVFKTMNGSVHAPALKLDSDASTLRGAFDLVILLAWPFQCDSTTVAELVIHAAQHSAHKPKIITVVDDARSAREADFHSLCNGSARTRNREIDLHARADLVLTLTDEDRSFLSHRQPKMELRTLPIAIKAPKRRILAASWSKRKPTVLCFIQRHQASRKGVRWLVRQVWPVVHKAIPDARLQVVGDAHLETEMRIGSDTGVETITSVYTSSGMDSTKAGALRQALQSARVVALPILASSSSLTDGSILALGHGVPLVATVHGARGLLSSRTPGAIAVGRTKEAFASELISLLSNESAWRKQQKWASVHIERHLTVTRLHRELRRAVNGF